MPFTSPFPVYTSPLLPVPHGMFCCAGGVSNAPFASLNLSYSVGDTPEKVQVNRARALQALGLEQLVSVRQVHGDRLFLVKEPLAGIEPEGYDALVSNLPGTGLLIQQADCQAILLWAPQHQVVAAVHCGWRGSVQGIIGKTIGCLQRQFGVQASSIRAVISPSLGPCCAEFKNLQTELPAWMHAYQVRPHYVDFWAISRRQLLEAGLMAEHIDIAAICTRCNAQFFSYRRAMQTTGGITGRNGSIIGLPRAGSTRKKKIQNSKSQINGA